MQKLLYHVQSLIEQAKSLYCFYTEPGTRFMLGWHSYPYFKHDYNATWTNERAVEVPIVMQLVDRVRATGPSEILEVGNVLSHYYDFPHDIVDKYEEAGGVINCDVIDYTPSKQYDLIVSISTLEHVGWDEELKGPDKILLAISHLKTLLKPGGKMVVTLPLGYNPPMDCQVKEGQICLGRHLFLKRVSEDNQWKQVGWEEVDGIKYGAPYKFANGLLIGILE